MEKPNILYIMTDQQRADTIAALGNNIIHTPNLDRLVRRGVSFTNAYSTAPMCVPARYTIRTGCEPLKTAIFSNAPASPVEGQADSMEERCGPYLARTMTNMGYRTFGIGKFHSFPWDEDLGYEIHMHSEERYNTPDQRARDSYASFIAKEHPEYDFVEGLHGERTEMYYMPQMSPLPAHLNVEGWAANEAIKQILSEDSRPYFGLVSFIGPHPPFAPPIPYNRMYNPDKMPLPIVGDKSIDHMDERIEWENYFIWADDVSDSRIQALKARYYGEISYIDDCLGKILDAVESREDSDNTLICFFTDHGEHLGDHRAWQKETFFEASCNVPFLLSWPNRLSCNVQNDELICLTDLFGLATKAAGRGEMRDGVDILGILEGTASPREYLLGYDCLPGTLHSKYMVRTKKWKYIFMANGGREQLFDMENDRNELRQKLEDEPEVAQYLKNIAVKELNCPAGRNALCGDELKKFPFETRPRYRIKQFDHSRGIYDFEV